MASNFFLLLLSCHGFSSSCAKLEEWDVGAIPGRKVSGTFDNELDLAISLVSLCVSCVLSLVPHIRSASGSESEGDHSSCLTPCRLMRGGALGSIEPSLGIGLRVTIVVNVTT